MKISQPQQYWNTFRCLGLSVNLCWELIGSGQNQFFEIWAFPGIFLVLFFLFLVHSLQLVIFTMVNDDRKQERRRKNVHLSITCYLKEPDTQWVYIDSNSELKKAKVWLGIQTRPAQMECHRSTTCATTTFLTKPMLTWELIYLLINPVTELMNWLRLMNSQLYD